MEELKKNHNFKLLGYYGKNTPYEFCLVSIGEPTEKKRVDLVEDKSEQAQRRLDLVENSSKRDPEELWNAILGKVSSDIEDNIAQLKKEAEHIFAEKLYSFPIKPTDAVRFKVGIRGFIPISSDEELVIYCDADHLNYSSYLLDRDWVIDMMSIEDY